MIYIYIYIYLFIIYIFIRTLIGTQKLQAIQKQIIKLQSQLHVGPMIVYIETVSKTFTQYVQRVTIEYHYLQQAI